MTSSEKFVLWLRSSFELPFDLGPCVPALAQCSNSICQTGVEVDLLTKRFERLDEDILIAQVWPTYPTHIVALESHCRSLSERARLAGRRSAIRNWLRSGRGNARRPSHRNGGPRAAIAKRPPSTRRGRMNKRGPSVWPEHLYLASLTLPNGSCAQRRRACGMGIRQSTRKTRTPDSCCGRWVQHIRAASVGVGDPFLSVARAKRRAARSGGDREDSRNLQAPYAQFTFRLDSPIESCLPRPELRIVAHQKYRWFLVLLCRLGPTRRQTLA